MFYDPQVIPALVALLDDQAQTHTRALVANATCKTSHLATLLALWRRINEFQIELKGVVMNQKSVNMLNLIAGLSSVSVGMMQIYKMFASDTHWIEISGIIGFLLTGLFLLFQKKFNPIVNIIIISIALICFIINFISFFI